MTTTTTTILTASLTSLPALAAAYVRRFCSEHGYAPEPHGADLAEVVSYCPAGVEPLAWRTAVHDAANGSTDVHLGDVWIHQDPDARAFFRVTGITPPASYEDLIERSKLYLRCDPRIVRPGLVTVTERDTEGTAQASYAYRAGRLVEAVCAHGRFRDLAEGFAN